MKLKNSNCDQLKNSNSKLLEIIHSWKQQPYMHCFRLFRPIVLSILGQIQSDRYLFFFLLFLTRCSTAVKPFTLNAEFSLGSNLFVPPFLTERPAIVVQLHLEMTSSNKFFHWSMLKKKPGLLPLSCPSWPPLSLHISLGSTVRLRFRKSISGHHFQNTRKFANNDFQYHRDVIYTV